MRWQLAILVSVAILAAGLNGFAETEKAEIKVIKPGEEAETKESAPKEAEVSSGQAAQPEKKWWQHPTMTGDWGGNRTFWRDHGVELSFFYNSFVGIRATGGKDPGSTTKHSGSVDFFLRTDFERMGLIPGGEIFMQVKNNHGKNINLSVGAISDPVDDADFTQPIYIDQLWYQQTFWGRKMQLRAGYLDLQTIIDRNAFANSEDVMFMNTLLDNNNAIIPLKIGFGAVLFFRPTNWLSFTVGASDRDNNILHAGWETAFDGLDSLMPYFETGFKPRISSSRGPLAGNYRIGVFNDPRSKTVWGTDRPWEDPVVSGNDVGVYVSFDQMLFAEKPNSSEGLGAFFRWGHRDETVNKLSDMWSAGLQYMGPFKARNRDRLGLGFYSVYGSQLYTEVEDTEFDKETGYEVYYSFQLTPWLTFTPDIQYIATPGGDVSAKDAWVIVFRTRFTL
jgi:porin